MTLLKRLLRPLLTLAVVAATMVLLVGLWRAYMLAPWTRDGRVSAEVVRVTPEVSGTVVEVRAIDNQFVHRGDILYVIDPHRFRLALDGALAVVLAKREDAALKAATARRRNQLGPGVAAPETIELANGMAAIAQADHDAARAAAHVAQINLDRTTIRAPVDGYVTNLRLRPGDYATAGITRVSVIDAEGFWITAYFEETKLSRIAIGARAEIRLMGFTPPVSKHVESIGHGIADANESPDHLGLPSVNPVFTWVRLAQRIPVRIHIDAVPPGVTLAAGMTCSVAVGEAAGEGRLLSRLDVLP
ncbi:biotin/lipoyl-binding protein [Methylobacterium pseudosasicola]|uniref:RND family efflux transporter, MFP subunit n=1 Tax=Methylobacterium pseudosasicola TaxID=582667 RepID=A0A1I4JX52_9HYPH|nr:HlyD family secretion protein [Methylobacterium pseudosasicola]SFL70807.1 RND family efflux transporter, MFP subunit [Methylobacterium pseudosasicola]